MNPTRVQGFLSRQMCTSAPADLVKHVTLYHNLTNVLLFHSPENTLDNLLRLFAWYEHVNNVKWNPVDMFVQHRFRDMKRTISLFITENSDTKNVKTSEWLQLYLPFMEHDPRQIRTIFPRQMDHYACFKSLYIGFPKRYHANSPTLDVHLLARFREFIVSSVSPVHPERVIQGNKFLAVSGARGQSVAVAILFDERLSTEQMRAMTKIAREEKDVEVHLVDLEDPELHAFDKIHILKYVDVAVLVAGNKLRTQLTLFMQQNSVVIHFCEDIRECRATTDTIRSFVHMNVERMVGQIRNIDLKQYRLDLSFAINYVKQKV